MLVFWGYTEERINNRKTIYNFVRTTQVRLYILKYLILYRFVHPKMEFTI